MKAFTNVFKLDWQQILGEDVSDLFSSWNIEEIYLISFFHTFSDVVVAYSNVFRSLLLSGISCQKDRSLVITVKQNFLYGKLNLTQERFDPRYLPCMAMYLASVEDNATVFCRLVSHETGELVRNRTYPVMDFRSSGFTARSLSVYSRNPLWFAPLNRKARFLVDPRYLTIYVQCLTKVFLRRISTEL